MPLWNLLPGPRCHQKGYQVEGVRGIRSFQRGCRMKNKVDFPKTFEPILKSLNSGVPKKSGNSRRDFLKSSGLLVVGFSISMVDGSMQDTLGAESAGAV